MVLSYYIQQLFLGGFIRKLLSSVFYIFLLFSATLVIHCYQIETREHILEISKNKNCESEKNTLSDSSSRSEEEQLGETIQETIETNISFSGWKGECAVLRQEDVLENGQIRTLFFTLSADGLKKPLDYTEWHDNLTDDLPSDPPNLHIGTAVISDFRAIVEFPKVLLKIEADEVEVRAFEDAIANLTPGKDIPSVKASLEIKFQASPSDKPLILWEKLTELRPYFGEASLEYRPPEIRFAVISPKKNYLLVFINDGTGLDYLLLRIRAK